VKIDGIDVDEMLKEVSDSLSQEEISPSLKSLIQVLLMVVKLLTNRVGLNSRNSSKPPSSDPNREKRNNGGNNRAPGGQKGHNGTTLRQVNEPDEVEVLMVDRATLPAGDYQESGYEKRQVFDIDIQTLVTEYQAQVLVDKNGHRFVAKFPEGVSKAVQYGNNLKAHVVYLSQYQLLPYKRIQDYFAEQLSIPISTGSIFNFNREAYGLLERFEAISKKQLSSSDLMHADETGVNIDGKRHWLHCHSNKQWTYFATHEKRGSEAMNAMGILPQYTGVVVHDHWKPYYRYTHCLHALCNAHHLRELQRAYEQDGQQWAQEMKTFLEQLNRVVQQSGDSLKREEAEGYRKRYQTILNVAQVECPPPDTENRVKKRGRVKRSKARNLLERLMDYENDVLRFMENPIVPFTNNQGENDIRMTKVQQKISGCFRSMEGAHIFCRVRGYLSTCRKQGVTSSQAMELLFNNKLPDFCLELNYAE